MAGVGKHKVRYRLIVNLSGCGNKGDTLTVLRENGETVLVSNGIKSFLIERKALSICPAYQ